MREPKTPLDRKGQKLERSENKSRYLETKRQRVRKLERRGTWEGVGMSCLRERGRINRGSWDTRWLGIMPTWPARKLQWLSKYCHSHTLYNISTHNFPVIKGAFIYTFLYFPGTNTEKNSIKRPSKRCLCCTYILSSASFTKANPKRCHIMTQLSRPRSCSSRPIKTAHQQTFSKQECV